MRYEDKNVKRNIVFYGRVSTEHEAQLSALENQMKWYDDQLERHENWTLKHKYIDRGITGTLAKKRPAFMQMIEDAKKGGFDLIVTRDVCRFARNTVDTLEYTRQLKKIGVEVYFVEDNIWTYASDGELRLTIMAALAQEESRKDSERVNAGLKMSREKGVLFGNGNILGYDLHRNIDTDGKWDPSENTYIINPEQAETVKLIYDMYCDGLGQTKICKELCRLQRKNACGEVKWSASKIGRILHNKTYAGYKGYLKSYTDDFLEHSRVKNLEKDSYMYVKGDWEPIISEEQWNQVQELCQEKTLQVHVDGTDRIQGKRKAEDIWLRKLQCSCGSSYRRNKWRTNKLTGEVVFGYQCYNQVNNGSIHLREKYGLDTDGYCEIPMVGDWKLNFMAKNILKSLWTDRQDAVEEAIELVRKYYVDDAKSADKSYIASVEKQIRKSENRIKNLTEMRMDGEITPTEYAQMRKTEEQRIEDCRKELAGVKDEQNDMINLDGMLQNIQATLDEVIDFSGPTIDNDVLERLILRITPLQKGRFKWVMNLLGDSGNHIICGVDGRKNAPTIVGDLNFRLSSFQPSTGCYC